METRKIIENITKTQTVFWKEVNWHFPRLIRKRTKKKESEDSNIIRNKRENISADNTELLRIMSQPWAIICQRIG